MEISCIIQLLSFIGTSIIFASWIAQNYFLKKWDALVADYKEQIKYITNLGDNYELHVFKMQLFQILVNTNNSPLIIDYFVQSLDKYLTSYLEMENEIVINLSKNKKKYSPDYLAKAQERLKELQQKVNQKVNNLDYIGLMDINNELENETSKIKDIQATEIMTYLKKLQKIKKVFNNIFLWLFIIGSLFLAISGILSFCKSRG